MCVVTKGLRGEGGGAGRSIETETRLRGEVFTKKRKKGMRGEINP